MILSYDDIIEAQKNEEIKIEPFDHDQIEAASYDLRIGAQGATASGKKLVNLEEKGFIVLKPGDFGLLITLEKVQLSPQHVARFGLRSKFARKGIIATTGPQIDPGFSGRLIVGVTNLTPKEVTFSYGDDFLTVEFHRLKQPTSKPYKGPYQGVTKLRPEDIENITESEGVAFSEVITILGSLSSNVGQLSSDVGRLSSDVEAFKIKMSSFRREMSTFKWVMGIGFAFLALMISGIGLLT